jgi:hypothetical protein
VSGMKSNVPAAGAVRRLTRPAKRAVVPSGRVTFLSTASEETEETSDSPFQEF